MKKKGEVIAIGSGRTIVEDRGHPLHDYLLNLSVSDRPAIGFLPTATGDSSEYITSFYQTYGAYSCTPSHLPLFAREEVDLGHWFNKQDIIYVGGGNTANMLAVWRLHGVDKLLGDFLEQGKIVFGGSAGGLCWFEGGVTDSFGLYDLVPLPDGLGFLPGSFCPHFNSDPTRKPVYEESLRQGILPPGYAVDDFAAVHFSLGEFSKAFALLPDAQAYRYDSKGKSEELAMERLY